MVTRAEARAEPARGAVPRLASDPVALGVLAVAAVLQAWLWSRSWLYHDQILLYRLGTDLVTGGEFLAWGKTMSGGSVIPGSLLQLAVAGPLALWFDFRSPTLALTLCLFAVLPVYRSSVASLWSPRVATLALVLLALSPWRLYHSGFLWEPHFLMVLGPLHLWACVRLFDDRRGRGAEGPPSVAASLLLGWIVVAAPQLHASGVVLGGATLVLLAARWLRPRWWALGVGAALGASTLLGALADVVRGSAPTLVSPDRLNLVEGLPLLEAFHYWVRMGSVDLGRRLRQATESDALRWIVGGAAILSILFALWANWRMWRRGRARRRDGEAWRDDPDLYVWALFAASMTAHALTSNSPQGWYSLVTLHAGVLPVALLLAGFTARRRRMALGLLLAVGLTAVAIIGAGHPMYQRPSDPAELERASPANLPTMELVPIPFGSHKERPPREELRLDPDDTDGDPEPSTAASSPSVAEPPATEPAGGEPDRSRPTPAP